MWIWFFLPSKSRTRMVVAHIILGRQQTSQQLFFNGSIISHEITAAAFCSDPEQKKWNDRSSFQSFLKSVSPLWKKQFHNCEYLHILKQSLQVRHFVQTLQEVDGSFLRSSRKDENKTNVSHQTENHKLFGLQMSGSRPGTKCSAIEWNQNSFYSRHRW